MFSDLTSHAIIAGYGLAGREARTALAKIGIASLVIESNPDTVNRCASLALRMLCGSATEVQTLQQAGILRARMLIITIPDDAAVLETVRQALSLNPSLWIAARCSYTSTGMEVTRLGAHAVVDEQVVAKELSRLIAGMDKTV